MPEMISRCLSVKLARWLRFWTWGIVGSCVVHETQLSVSWLLCPCQLIWRRECCHTTYRAWPFIISCELQVGSYWQTIFYLIFVQHLAKWDLISNYCCQNTGIRWMHHSSAASSGGMYRIATTSDKTPDTHQQHWSAAYTSTSTRECWKQVVILGVHDFILQLSAVWLAHSHDRS